MAAKVFFSCAFSFLGLCALSAQTTVVFTNDQSGALDTANIVGQLEQTALLALLGAVALMGIAWICSVVKACYGLKKPNNIISPN